jgi:hypothetical protein
MPSDLKPNVVSDTLSELANPDDVSRDRVMQRLKDWQRRVHDLYGEIQRSLPAEFVTDREGKHRSQEELVQRTHLSEDEVPALDILRIEHPVGTLRALLYPRRLWIIGANGTLELRLIRPPNHQSVYRILDMSRPMVPPAKWWISPLADPTDERPFSGSVFRSMLR